MTENMNECSFCELLRDVKERADRYASAYPSKGNEHSECKVALTIEDFCDSNLSRRISYNPRALNFCPVCARKIDKEEICW